MGRLLAVNFRLVLILTPMATTKLVLTTIEVSLSQSLHTLSPEGVQIISWQSVSVIIIERKNLRHGGVARQGYQSAANTMMKNSSNIKQQFFLQGFSKNPFSHPSQS